MVQSLWYDAEIAASLGQRENVIVTFLGRIIA
jgi:hypothetical protein